MGENEPEPEEAKKQSKQPARRCKINELEPGMILARDVFSSDGCVLLQADKSLDIESIERLKRWDKRFVYVYPEGQDPETYHSRNTQDNSENENLSETA